jgi:nicotinamidase-related amidase
MQTDTALLLIDLINPLDFECGDRLYERALPAARAAAALQSRARSAGVTTIYVNDCFETGATGLKEMVERHRARGGRAAELLDVMGADPDRDHFVAKTRHSGFYRTGLEVMLRRMRIEHLILTGVAADICVLATAFDAHMRGFDLSVPCDCVASESAEAELWALRHMARVLEADVRPSFGLCLPNERSRS